MDTEYLDTDSSTATEPLSLRWRLAGRALPLYERHIRSLRAHGVSAPSLAWVRSRLEWTLDTLPEDRADGVLCLDIDSEESVEIRLEPLRPLPTLALAGLCVVEDRIIGISDAQGLLAGTVWVEQAGELMAVPETQTDSAGVLAASTRQLVSAADTFARDMVRTLGYTVTIEPVIASVATADRAAAFFLISDEFGLVPIGSQTGSAVRRLQECFEKLYTAQR